MASNELIDVQFDRAVEIVQGLPKTGPIQTDYEEKLTMYSLYKQATIGNVKSPRPGIWDMLGRAKWDAWAKHKDLNSYEAKWLYVESLLKVLRKYSDKTIARSLVEELESYGGDPSNIVLSRTFSKSPASDSSGSTASEDNRVAPSFYRSAQQQPQQQYGEDQQESASEEETDEDEARELPNISPEPLQAIRPHSSMSSHRYRTPVADSHTLSPPPPHIGRGGYGLPQSQPMPGFETPSAFAEPSAPSLYPGNLYGGHISGSSQSGHPTPPPQQFYGNAPYRVGSQTLPVRQFGPAQPASRPTLERAVENMQAQLAALNERLEFLESLSPPHSRSHMSASPRPAWGQASPSGRTSHEWDLDDIGMWSMVVKPMSRGLECLRVLAHFFAKNEQRSPSLIILRRLCLDASFLICILGIVRLCWRSSGVRRREVHVALKVLWRAILGSSNPRAMVDRGI